MADPVSLAITAALTVAQMGLTAMNKIEGPRLEDLKVTVADYGAPLNYFYGTRRFEGAPIIWAEELREVKKKRKTKGGKYNDYQYFGTWAIVVADHEIDAVTRIWFDKHLVYDATGAGPITPFPLGKKFNLQDSLRIYLGTEDQEPDPRMLATVEAEHGAGSCPAYRGVSIIVFEEIPLEKLGNRLPQIMVEAVNVKTDTFPYTTVAGEVPGAGGWQNFSYSPDYSKFAIASLDGFDPVFQVWDVATHAMMFSGEFGGEMFLGEGIGIDNEGYMYAPGSVIRGMFSFDVIFRYPPEGGAPTELCDVSVDQGGCYVMRDGLDNQYLGTIPFSSNGVSYFGGVGAPTRFSPVEIFGDDWATQGYCEDGYGDIWTYGCSPVPGGTTSTIYFYRSVNVSGRAVADYHAVTVATEGPSPNLQVVHNLDAGQFVANWNDAFLYQLDDVTFAIEATESGGGFIFGNDARFRYHPAGAPTIWIGYNEIDLATLATLRTVDPGDWVVGTSSVPAPYDPINHALIAQGPGDAITWLYLDRVAGNGVTLGSIVQDVCQRVGIDPANVDVTGLDQIVLGYSWTQGDGKSILSPLLDLHDSDARPHDFATEFVKRGSASAGTIDVAEFQAEDPRYSITVAQDTDLPRRLTMTFADPDADQQANSVVVQRPIASVDAVRETSIDLTTVVMAADEARQLAERYFRRIWNERETYSLGLTAQRMGLEPADVWGLALDDVSRTARLTKLTFAADDSLKTEWIRDYPSLAALTVSVGAPADGHIDYVITVPGIAKGFVMDIPLIRDGDNDTNPILYYAASSYSEAAFVGADILQADAGEYNIVFGVVTSTDPAVWGSANDALPDATCAVWDRGNSVNITMHNGEMTSATEAECDVSPMLNMALLGQEIIQFTTATLEGDGSYTLTGLKRGRRGTEWATGTHIATESLVLLQSMPSVEMGLSDVGTAMSFKAVAGGRDPDSAYPINFTYSAASLKPHSPTSINAVKDAATGDWTISWVRRSRVGGAWVGGTSVPLGETSEAYEVVIGDRVIETSSASAVYTSAMQASDGGSVAVGDLDLAVYQMSDAVGRGFGASASF